MGFQIKNYYSSLYEQDTNKTAGDVEGEPSKSAEEQSSGACQNWEISQAARFPDFVPEDICKQLDEFFETESKNPKSEEKLNISCEVSYVYEWFS